MPTRETGTMTKTEAKWIKAIGAFTLTAGGALAALSVLRRVWHGKTPQGADAPGKLSFSSPTEPYAAQDPANSCSPAEKPGAKAFRAWVLGLGLGGYDAGIARDCAAGGTSEHKEGRAWDWGIAKWQSHDAVPPENIEGFLAALLQDDAELARRAGVMYMIYNRRIWSAARHAEGWRPYSGPSAHTDHVHFSLSRAGGDGKTSLYTEALLANRA